eukprot:5299101-Pyramimonas_sp.AAC.1
MATILATVEKPEDLVAFIVAVHKGAGEHVNSSVEFRVDAGASVDAMPQGEQEASPLAVTTAAKSRKKRSAQVGESPKGSCECNGAIENVAERAAAWLRAFPIRPDGVYRPREIDCAVAGSLRGALARE